MATKTTAEELKPGQVWLRRGRWYAVTALRDSQHGQMVCLYSGTTGCEMTTYSAGFWVLDPTLKKVYNRPNAARDEVDRRVDHLERITARLKRITANAKRFKELQENQTEEDRCRQQEQRKARRKRKGIPPAPRRVAKPRRRSRAKSKLTR